MANLEKREAAADALLERITEQAARANMVQTEILARAYRAVVGGDQPAGSCDCSAK